MHRILEGKLDSDLEAKKRAKEASKTRDKVEEIFANLTPEDRRLLGCKPDENRYMTEKEEQWVAKRFLIEIGNKPIAFFDVLTDGISASVCFAVRSDWQKKGYGQRITKMGNDWIDKNLKLFDHVEWNILKENIASKKLAERYKWERWPSRDYKNSVGEFECYIKSPRS